MKILLISDTHNYGYAAERLPKADLVIHTGDACMQGTMYEWQSVCNWAKHIVARYKNLIFVPGNHDLIFDGSSKEDQAISMFPGKILINDFCEINGLTIYGSPVCPPIGYNWYYFFNQIERYTHWQKELEFIKEHHIIPDIIATHSPAFGIMDQLYYNKENKGCNYIKDFIDQTKPLIHCFGHIHEEFGIKQIDGIWRINSSFKNHKYKNTNFPILVELEKTDKWKVIKTDFV